MKKNKLLTKSLVFILTLTLLLSSCIPAFAAWKKVNNNWYYLTADGRAVTGWQKINGEWYHFDKNGVRDTGWKYVSNGWYNFGTDGIRKTGWQKINGEWYHFDKNGIRDTGWKYVSNGWYYFGTDGIRKTGWQDIDGKRYFLDDNGIRQTGFLYHTYYLQEDGSMAIGWTEIDGELYYFDDYGVMYRHKWIDNQYINYEGKLKDETAISFDEEFVKVDISYWEGVPANAVKASCEDADLIQQLISQIEGLKPSQEEYKPMAGGSVYNITLYYADGSSEQCNVIREQNLLNYNDIWYDIDVNGIDTVWEKISN